MKVTREPLKPIPVALRFDADGAETPPVFTDRAGLASFDLPPSSGKVLVSGVERCEGRLADEIPIERWSITQSEQSTQGQPGAFPSGSNAYPSMSTRAVQVGARDVLTDSEGDLVDPSDWSEDFARALAMDEGLALNAEHWEVIRFLRSRFARSGAQATVRDMIVHFRQVWGRERGSNRYSHRLFPRGGPQKQGNRLAGRLRAKGEHRGGRGRAVKGPQPELASDRAATPRARRAARAD